MLQKYMWGIFLGKAVKAKILQIFLRSSDCFGIVRLDTGICFTERILEAGSREPYNVSRVCFRYLLQRIAFVFPELQCIFLLHSNGIIASAFRNEGLLPAR